MSCSAPADEPRKRASSIEYHLRELQVARDPESPRHILPAIGAHDLRILDVGCGIGQTLVCLDRSVPRQFVGIDVDRECLMHGRREFADVEYVEGMAENLPFSDGCFDLVISRVALPYTNLSRSLPEISRVLAEGGRVWLTLHSFSKAWRAFVDAMKRRSVKEATYHAYVMCNGISLRLFAREFRLPMHDGYESFQTRSGMRKLLKRAGLQEVRFELRSHFVCMARKAPRAR